MDNNSPYLWNPPEGADNQSIEKIQNDRLDEILQAPVTGQDIAYRYSRAMQEKKNPNLTFDEFKLYDEWHKQQEINWWEVASSGFGMFFSDIGKGLATLQPFGKGNSLKEASLNLTTRLGPTAAEAFARGTRDLIGMAKIASENQNSPFYRLLNPNGDVYTRYLDFNSLTDWNITSQKLVDGDENILLPNTSKMIGKDASLLDPAYLFQVNTALAHAGSYFLDPIALATMGGESALKAGLTVAVKEGAKAGAKSASEVIMKSALKEGITGAESAARNTATIMDKGRILGAGMTEKVGKSFRVAGELVDRPINIGLDWIKKQADELFDTNLHQTVNANLRVTGPVKGQAGFGGSLMAGIGLGSIGLPFAGLIVPVWATAQAARIGGGFFEAVGKEMLTGSGVLGRVGKQAGSAGKLARTFQKWGPMSDYVKELSKATAKSAVYGTGIGYAVGGEEGAAQGLGMGAAIGTTHYHWGIASNVIKGQSREKMTIDLVNNINAYREKGFTKKADTVLKYLEEIRAQHGDDNYFRNLGVYLAFEADADVALSIWDKEDYLRLANDPSVEPQVREAINAVIAGGDPEKQGQGWNGLFMGRKGDSKPYFIHKDSQSGKTHVIINAWAIDNAQKTQATGLKGEFFHVLGDAYKEAATKERFKEEVFEGLVRTLGADHTPEGRTKMAQMLRNAANNLSVFSGDLKAQKASKREKNLLKVYRKNAPAGWKAEFVMGNEVIVDNGVKRPPLYWDAGNGWRIRESNGRYELTGRVDNKFIRREYASLNEAVRDHKLVAPIDHEVKSTAQVKKPKTPKAEFEAKAGPRAGEREGFDANVADIELTQKATGIVDTISRKVHGKSAKEFQAADKATYDSAINGFKQALADGWVFDETKIDIETQNYGFSHPDYPNAKLDEFYDDNGNRRTSQGTTPPNAAGERTAVKPEATQPEAPKQKADDGEYTPEQVESIYRQIDDYEKTGNLSDGSLATLIEEMGESVWDAHEADMPFDYIYLAGDLGVARNLIEELKHRFSRIVDRNARQAGFVPDFSKDFVDWFKDRDGKAIVDPYMRDLYKKFLRVHKNRKNNLNIYNVDYAAFSPSALKTFVEENQIEHEYDKDPATGNYVRKAEETINRESHQRHQAAYRDLLAAEKAGVDTGFHIYALDKDAPDIGHLDEENSAGTMQQQAWRQYRTTVDDIKQAQRKGTIPTREELQDAIKNANFGRRGRPRTGEIDDVIASAEKGSIIFSGVPTLEGFKILQKHLAKGEMAAIAQVAPLILDGGLTQPNVLRIKYAGFQHAPEEGPMLKRGKNEWTATEKNMVFYGMELRGTLRNLKTGKFDYKRPHAHFLVHGVDIDVLQRRIQHMWSKEKETRKRWANMVDFEKDVYRLIENYSTKTAIAGSRFFGGGAEGKAKKRLACAAIGAFPTRDMVGGLDGDEGDFEMPEIDWHHYQFRAYGKGNQGRDIPWTALRGEGIKKVYGTNDTMRVPYAERAYYRAQEMFQAASKKAPREGEDSPANMRFVSQELQGGRVNQILSKKRPTGHHLLAEKGYTPSDVIKSIVDGQFKLSPEKQKNVLDFVKGGIGHDEATNSALVFWHWSGSGIPFETIEQGQIGMHFGTREAALARAMKVAEEIGIDPVSVANNTFPIVVNIKKPLIFGDRGAWSPDDIVDTILYANLDSRVFEKQPNVEGFHDWRILDPIKEAIGPLSQSDIQFLLSYKDSLAKNGINARNTFLAQAEMSANKGQTPAFESISKRMYKAAEPLHKWLETKGIDGIKYRNNAEGTSWSYIAFSGKQAKHLVSNSGEYSPKSLSMMRQQASTFGAKSEEGMKALDSNYKQAVKEGDIFSAISIKDNFLGDMPMQTKVIRQTADEAIKQGMTPEQYNSQFATGSPAVFPVLKGESKLAWASQMTMDMEAKNALTSRALVKTKNPLVIDASGLALESAELNANSWIQKAQDSKNDAVIFTNTTEGIKTVVLGNDNIAVTDMDTRRESVPRGAGLLNSSPDSVPFRQETQVKRTFYSAVEKFVEEKVTDKTSLNELLGLMDPTKGTGIVKSELEFLDIAGWVEEQKKINGGTKAKVNKQELLKYIAEHKFELQEDKTNTAWYSLQGLDPNNPLVQSQVEGGYEGYAPANKGYDELHPSTNYRVLLLRAPAGTDYSGGEGGHFPQHENIMAFARVSDVYLDRATEMPSPPTGQEYRFANQFISPNHTVGRESQVERADITTKNFLNKIGISMEEFRQLSSDEIAIRMLTADPQEYGKNGERSVSEKIVSDLGFVFERIKDAMPPAKADAMIDAVYDWYFKHSDAQQGIFSFWDKAHKDLLAEPRTDTWRKGTYLFQRFEALLESLPDDRVLEDGSIEKNSGFNDRGMSTTGRVTSLEKLDASMVDAIDILKSFLRDESEIQDANAGKKKMLFVMEMQSDTAQKMQGRNDSKTAGVRTPQERARVDVVVKRIEEINQLISDNADKLVESEMALYPQSPAVTPERRKEIIRRDILDRTYELQPDLYKEREELMDERATIANKRDKTVMSQRDFEKLPEVKAELKKRMEVFDTWQNWAESKEKNLEARSDLTIDDGFVEGTQAVMDKLGMQSESGIIVDGIIVGGKEKFIENFNVLIDRLIASDVRYPSGNEAKDTLRGIKQSVSKNNNITAEEINQVVHWSIFPMFDYDKSRLPYYDLEYFLGVAEDYATKYRDDAPSNAKVKRVGRIMHEEVAKLVKDEIFDTSVSNGRGFASGAFKTNDFSKENLLSIIDAKVDEFTGGTLRPAKTVSMDDVSGRAWGAWEEHSLSDKNSYAYDQFREKVLRMVIDAMDIHERQSPNSSQTREQVKTAQLGHIAYGRDTVVTEYMPFLRTEDFTKLMFKKVLREAVSNGYEGIIFIPAELPQILTGGDSKYFYGKIVPKVVEGVTKKFGGKLRQNKSLPSIDASDPLLFSINNYLIEAARNNHGGNFPSTRFEAWEVIKSYAKNYIDLEGSPTQPTMKSRFVDEISTTGKTSKEIAEQILDFFVKKQRGLLPQEQRGWDIDDKMNISNSVGSIDKQASRKGLILDVTPQMDAIKEGQPMWQAASRKPRKPKAEGQAETVGDVRGLGDGAPIPKKDRSIGEREEGSAIQSIPKDTAQSVMSGMDNKPATEVDKRLAVEGVADYRGYKLIYDKANGGYKITDPAGKRVMIPVAYKDKFTGEMVVKTERTVMFPQEGVDLIDHLLGGLPKKADVASAPLAKPAAKPNVNVVEPAQRAIPKSGDVAGGAVDEVGIVQSQLEKSGKSKYYLYNVAFDPDTKQYIATDNSGQVIPTIVNNPFQSGPATMQANGNPDLKSLLGQLDKKFDKAKWARLAPRANTPAVSQTQAPVAPAPMAPVALAPVVSTPAPVATPTRRVSASSVPPAVAQSMPATPTPKPKPQPKPKPNVNTDKPKPKVVLPVEPVAKDVNASQTQTAQPVEVVSDKEYMDRQAKAMGKGFIAMMKDPDMAQYIIDSLNIDDNLTLKGDNETASTADGRFSVNKKGKKYIITQNNYDSPITGLRYDKRTIAYVNTIDQAQMLIRRLEVERNMGLVARKMPMENPLMVMAAENPAFADMARQKAIRDNAFVMMLLSMRDQGITPIYIDPNTLQPILVMMPSEEAIAQVTRPNPRQQPNIAGLLPENGSQERLLPAILDEAIKFDYIMDAQIKQMAQTKKDIAERYMNSLGYEILKFQGKFRLFNPLKNAISVRDDEDAIMNDLIRDIAKKGIPQ